VAASSKDNRYSVDLQVAIDACIRLVIATNDRSRATTIPLEPARVGLDPSVVLVNKVPHWTA
jgi:hypothetical protein